MPTLYMMTSSNGNICTLLALCVRGIYRSSVNSPHKGQWRGALMFSLICAWINAWVNNREAGDLRRNRTHYGVIVMKQDIHTLMSTMLHVTSFSDIVPMLVHFTNICVIYRHRNGKVARVTALVVTGDVEACLLTTFPYLCRRQIDKIIFSFPFRCQHKLKRCSRPNQRAVVTQPLSFSRPSYDQLAISH